MVGFFALPLQQEAIALKGQVRAAGRAFRFSVALPIPHLVLV